MNKLDKQIREAIKTKLRNLGRTNVDIAKQLNVSPQAVGQIIKGDRGKIPDSLISLLAALGLKIVVIDE